MKERGMSLRAALGHVLSARPQASPNSGFLQQLKELEKELTGFSTLEDVEELPRREADRLALFLDGEIGEMTSGCTISTPALTGKVGEAGGLSNFG